MKNWKTDRPSQKLVHQIAGPYRILEKISNSYKINLSVSVKVYPVILPDCLRKAANNPLPKQYNNLPPVIEVDRKDE